MSIERRGKRFSVRLGRKRLGTFSTMEAAEHAERGGDLAAYWEEWVPRRRKSGVRDTAGEEQRWELYVAQEGRAKGALR